MSEQMSKSDFKTESKTAQLYVVKGLVQVMQTLQKNYCLCNKAEFTCWGWKGGVPIDSSAIQIRKGASELYEVSKFITLSIYLFVYLFRQM